MRLEAPYTSCFLTRMLILYLEKIGKDGAIDYPEILNAAGFPDKIRDPIMFLKDYNNWVPHPVLKALILSAEKTAKNKEIAYCAAKDYFQSNRAPSLLEIIVKLLDNMDDILAFSNLWAGGFTNYLKLQCLKSPDSKRNEVVFLAQFSPQVEPCVGSIQFIRGNYEGFTRMFGHIEDACCGEEISQLKVENIVEEFGDYQIQKTGPRLSIMKRGSQQEIAAARAVHLQTEMLPTMSIGQMNKKDLVSSPHEGKVRVLTMRTEKDPDKQKEGNTAYEIIHQGTLESGNIKYTFLQGQIFNAPYSRFRFQWRSQEAHRESSEMRRTTSEIAPLLFDHIRSLREDLNRLLSCTVKTKALAEANIHLKLTIKREFDFFGIIGKTDKMQRLFDQARVIGQTKSTVLIIGETGTGKELLARAIHQLSRRKAQRFFAINCAALPESLLESELFGHEKGSFTGATAQKKGIFETAHGGSLFLDEVGDLSSAMQAKLLRVLEEQEIRRVGGNEMIPVNVRIL